MSRAWQHSASRVVYENPWIRVVEYDAIRPDGSACVYAVVETKSRAVTVVAISDDNKVCLIHEYRFPLDAVIWRLPTGGTNSEQPTSLAAAKAELREETGFIATSWSRVGRAAAISGLSPEVADIYLARNLLPSNGHMSDPDIHDIGFFSMQDITMMIRRGTLFDGQCLAAITVAIATDASLARQATQGG